MADKGRDHFVHDLLDASLAHYGGATPRAGLEGRVLARVRAQQQRPAWFAWTGAVIAGAVAVALIVSGLSMVHHRARRPGAPVLEAQQMPWTSAVERAPLKQGTKQARASRTPASRLIQRAPDNPANHATVEVQTSLFPSPQPLTKQEELLVQYVRATPAFALAAQPIDRIEIPDLEFKPLDTPPLDSGETETRSSE